MDETAELLTTDQAAALLRVKPASVYAYVSRGLLRSRRAAGGGPSLFVRAEVERLASQRGRRERAARSTSARLALTEIRADRLYYRGQDACELARSHSFEQVAELLWHGDVSEQPRWIASGEALALAHGVQAVLPPATPPTDRLSAVVPALAAGDPLRLDLAPAATLAACRSLMAALAVSLPLAGSPPAGASFAAQLWARLTPQPATPASLAVLDATLVLLADHGERPPATSAARLAASLRSDPYAAVLAALGVGSGAQQSGPFLTLQRMFAQVDRPDQALDVLGAQLRQGELLPGFHPRQYQRVDPRAQLILALLRERLPASARFDGIQQLVRVLCERRQATPSVEVAVAAFAAITDMLPGAGEAVFLLARTAGWLAHALQVYQQAPRTDLPSFVNP